MCGIYRPQSSLIENFTSQLESFLNGNILRNSNCIIGGDLNINLFSESDEVNGFIDMMRSHHYIQTITDITRPSINQSVPTLIDHIWLNQFSNYNCGIIRTGVTDHHTLYLQVPFASDKSNTEKIKIHFRDCSLNNQDLFEQNLLNYNWDIIKSEDANEYLDNFVAKLNEIYRLSFPIKTKFVTHKYFKNPWHSKELKKLKDYGTKYHALYLEGLVTHAEYSRYRNKITSIIRKTKESYYCRLFNRNMGNIKQTWKLINNICSGHEKRTISKINANGIDYTDPNIIADLFNKYFVSIADELAENLPNSTLNPFQYIRANTQSFLVLDPVTTNECSAVITALKLTKQDINCTSVEMFKKFHHIYVNVLTNILNLCFTTSTFPKSLKHATVVPVFKKGEKDKLSNYRPIANLPFMSKVLERCIFTRLSNYATACNILSPNQFGFRKGKSTQDAILLLTEEIYNSFNEDDGSFCINIFIDFQKCFDTIDHVLLINKMRLYGIDGAALCLLESYLSERSQSVRIGNVISSSCPVSRGVPQGSILGPLLFLYFINDAANISNNFVPILFADDTTLSFKCSTLTGSNTLCNNELEKFFEWSTANKLTINKSKTFYILHTYRTFNMEQSNITLNGHLLENFDKGMFLGIMIDKKLTFQPHIDHISAKISKSIGILFKLSSLKTPKPVLKQVYYSLIHSYLNYNICCYAGTYDTHLNRLFILQKRAIRIINSAPRLAHTNHLFYSSGILKIHDLYKLNVALIMYEHRHLGQYERSHSYDTRFRANLLPNRSRLTVSQNSISVVGPNLWNTIPTDIQNIPSRDSFKYFYKKYLLSAYNEQ